MDDRVDIFGFGIMVGMITFTLILAFLGAFNARILDFEDGSAVICNFQEVIAVRDAESQDWRLAANLEINICAS